MTAVILVKGVPQRVLAEIDWSGLDETPVSPPVGVRGGSPVVRERGGSQGLQLSPCLVSMFCHTTLCKKDRKTQVL